jgi:2-alkenal reductase
MKGSIQMTSTNQKRAITLAFAIAILLLAGLACSLSPSNNGSQEVAVVTAEPLLGTTDPEQMPITGSNAPVVNTQNPIGAADLQAILIELYQRINPSVVHILVYTSANDPLPLGSGSGFIYDDEGHIVTNNHVVEDGVVFEVIFSDNSRSEAEVVGRDVDSDLAVIRAEDVPSSARPVTLGNSDSVRIGEFVIAIGNPFGQQGSMSLGIISGLARSLESQREAEFTGGRYTLPGVIQTDAPINPGNSGGPLLNLQGEVVGINSAIRSTTGVNSGVGFAIPVNAVRRIVPSLIANGNYTYSYMGVQIRSLNLNLVELLNLPQVNGAYVIGVTSGGPAERAGLIPARDNDGLGGDLIVAIEGEPILDTEQLIAYLVFHTEVGQTIELTVIRNGENITVPLTLDARP